MTDAKRDANSVTTLLALSNVDGVTPVTLWADPVTHRLLVDVTGSSGFATTALDNLSSVAINAALVLGTSDAFALGSATKMWSDLFLASGAVINFNNGDVTITHSANALTFAGGTVSFDTAPTVGAAAVYYTGGTDVAVTDGGTGLSAIAALSILVANSANTYVALTPGAGNSLRVNAGGTAWEAYTPGSSGATTALDNLASVAINAALVLGTSDAFALGSATKMWADLFLASGAVVNFNNGDVTLTHSAGILTLAGTLALGTNSITMTGSIGATGARVTKIWAAAGEFTAAPTVSGANVYYVGGTDVAVADGGTGLSSIAALSTIVANSSNTYVAITPGAGQSIRINAGNTAWEAYTPGSSGATTALDNLASVAINTALILGTSDAAALGSATKMWADLFLASGAVINFNNGDVTMTHAANALAFAGGTVSFDAAPTVGASAVYYAGGTDVAVADGGTGKSSWTQWLIPYADTTTSFAQIAIGTSGQVLTSNGAGAAPTFQTASGGGSIKKVVTWNVLMSPGCSANFKGLAVNTTMYVNLFNVPSQIVVNQIIGEAVDAVGTAGTIDVTIYSEDGATKYIAVTSGTISATGMFNIAVSAVTLPAGNYYLAVNTNSTASLSFWNFALDQVTDAFNAYDETNNKPTACGTLTITAGTPPATIDPTAIVADVSANIIFQLNN